MEYHVQHLNNVLTLLSSAEISLELQMFKIFQHEVNYLGHVLSAGNLAIDSCATRGFLDAVFSQDFTKYRSFLGECSVYRRFIDELSKAVYPLKEIIGEETYIDQVLRLNPRCARSTP